MIQITKTSKPRSVEATAPRAVRQAKTLRTAKISEFRAPTPKILFGERLAEITDLETSIAAYGLLKPLKVCRASNKLVVIDGRKRLTALRRMRFKNTLPRSLTAVPYVMSTEPVPHIQSAQQQYISLIQLENSGVSRADAAEKLCLSAPEHRALRSIDRLSDYLKNAFLKGAITAEQARAFATIPNHNSQERLLMYLGPFASPEEILRRSSNVESTHKTPNCVVTVTKAPAQVIQMKPPTIIRAEKEAKLAA